MNILQQLVAQAQQKKQQLQNTIGNAAHTVGNDISHIGAAPHPVQTLAPQAQQQIQNARYGVLANNPAAQQNFIHQQAQPHQGVLQGLNTAVQSPFLAVPKVAVGTYNVGKGIGTSAVNTVQTPYSAGRVVAANLTGNKQALTNAHKALGSDSANNLLWNDAYRQTGNELAGALYAHTYEQKTAAANKQLGNTIAKAYGNTPKANAYGSLIESASNNQSLNDYLNNVGIDQNTSKGMTALKLGVPIVSAGAQTALQAVGLGTGAKVATAAAKDVAAKQAAKMTAEQANKQAVKQVLTSANRMGLTNAGISVLSPLSQGDKNVSDYLKAAGSGYLGGAGMTLAGAAGAEPVAAAKAALSETARNGKAIHSEVSAANAKKATIANYNATINDLQKQKADLKSRIQNTDNFRGVETTQQHIDQIDGQIAQTKANMPKLTIKDRILAPSVGFATQKVTTPVDQYHSMYADALHQMDATAPGGNKFKAEANGSPVMSGKSPFYRQFRADNGKAPTKADYKAEAVRQLTTGKADPYAQEEYNALKSQPTAPVSPAKPAPVSPKPAAKPQLPASRGIVSGSSAKNTIPAKPVDTQTYLKQQTQAQEAARKAGTATGLDKVKAGVAEVKAKMVDSLSPIEDRLNTKITAENATGHITPQLDRALRADSITGQYIKDNGLAKVIQNVPDTKEFDQYLIAKHAADLEKNGIKTGRNATADAQLVKDLGGKYEEHAQALKQYSQGLLDKAVDYGLISKDLAKGLKEKYPNYVPANRIFGDNELVKPPKGVGGGNASIGQQSVVQKIKGSNRAIESPLASIINKTSDVIKQGERNKAAQILAGYKSLPGNPFNLRELKPSETVGEKHVISVLDNGKQRRFETDPAIAAAAKSLNKEQLGLVGKILNAPVRVLRMGATTLNPAFTGANIAKDMVTGAINSKNPIRSSVANPQVFLQALKASLNHGSKEYGELVREGAGGTSFDIARDAPKQNVSAIRAQKNAPSKIAYTVTHPAQLFRAAENAIGRSEEFTRALQYYGGKQGAKASGASEEASRVLGAHAARNNTTNFARSGDFGKALNSVIPYLNAGFQGSRTLVRNLGDRPAQTAGKMVVGAFMPVAAVTAWNVSDPKRKAAYDDIKQYEKQGNIIIVPPNPVKDPNTGKWNVIKIPLSQEVANLGNVVRNGIETGMKDGSFDAKGLVGDLLGTATSLNLQSPRQAFGQVMPQALKVPAEMITNQNLYTGNKIVPDSQKNLDPKDQYGPTSSGTAKTIGKLTNTSPRQIDNAVRTGVGGLGQNIINASDNALAKLGIIQPTDIKGTSFAKAASNRFNGAQGSNQYDAIDTKTADLTKQLKALPGYQNMSNTDKAKALSRLTNQITQTYTSKKALTPKQQAIDNGSIKVSDYLAPSTGSGKSITVNTKIDSHSQKVLGVYNSLNADQNKQKAYAEPSWDYKVAQAKYDNAVANGTLSKSQQITQKDAVTKAKVGSNYSKDTRDLYGMSKQEVYNLITTDQNGKKYAQDLLAYGDALQQAGIEKNKFRTSKGVESFGDGTNSATKANSGPSLATLLAGFKTPYSDMVKNSTKGASLARNAHLSKKKA